MIDVSQLPDVKELKQLHTDFFVQTKKLICPVTAVAFLALISLIVICSSLTGLILPGVNVIRDVILPGVLPGIAGLLLSLPFLIDAVKKSAIKTRIYEKNIYPKVKAIFQSNAIYQDFETNLLDKELGLNDFKTLNEKTVQALLARGHKTLRQLLQLGVDRIIQQIPQIHTCDPDYENAPPPEIAQPVVDRLIRAGFGNVKVLLEGGIASLKAAPMEENFATEIYKEVEKELKEKWKLEEIDKIDPGLRKRLTDSELDTLGSVLEQGNLEQKGFSKNEVHKIRSAAALELENIPLSIKHVAPGFINFLKTKGLNTMKDILERSQHIPSILNESLCDEILQAARNAWPSEIVRLIENKRKVLFVETHIFTLDNPREYQDYFRTLLMRLIKEYGEDQKKGNIDKKWVKIRTQAMSGALENLIQPIYRKRN